MKPEPLNGDLGELLAGRKSAFNIKMGKALQKRKDTVYEDFRLERASNDTDKKVGRWQVRQLSQVSAQWTDDDFSDLLPDSLK